MIPALLLAFTLVAPPANATETEFSHHLWDQLVQDHVQLLNQGRESRVDYQGMGADEEKLEQYLQTLAEVSIEQFDGWSKEDQLAFLINGYNGWTVKLILSKYPDLVSIKDLGYLFQSPWKRKFILLLGKKRSLDDIEHNLIRGSGRYNEPRIHFAVNCASIGCPALSNRAYIGRTLDNQLEEATRLFLTDRTRNRMKKGRLRVSAIFKWYRDDFQKGWRGANSLEEFLLLYRVGLGLDKEQAQAVASAKIAITFLDYDWQLNGTR